MSASTLADRRPAGVMFHHFHGGGHPAGPGAISADDLDAMIGFIGRERLLPARDWHERARTGRLAEGQLCITFDDNLRCQYDIARPVLAKHGLTAFWFVYTGANTGKSVQLEIHRYFRTTRFDGMEAFYAALFAFLKENGHAEAVRAAFEDYEPAAHFTSSPYLSDNDKRYRFLRDAALAGGAFDAAMDAMMAAMGANTGEIAGNLWMSDAELTELHEAGHLIGLHSHSHPTVMANLPAAQQRDEYRANAEHLAKVLGETVRSMSHPSNSYSADTLAILADLGIEVGFRADMAMAKGGPLEWPRHNHATIFAEMGRRA